ncbi:MAG: hypothetical protein R3C49_20375 [Planctomycetaceae bacterium]
MLKRHTILGKLFLTLDSFGACVTQMNGLSRGRFIETVSGLWTAVCRNVRRHRRRSLAAATQEPGECLEVRVLPTISGLTVDVTSADTPDRFDATFSWNNDDASGSAWVSYELWIDQVVSFEKRRRESYYQKFTGRGADVAFQPNQEFVAEQHIAWVRQGKDSELVTPTARLAFRSRQ